MTSSIGEIAYERVGAVNIRLARSGAGSGIPIVFLSPWPESIWGFRGVIPALQGLGPVIAVDLPGFGLSDGAARYFSPFGMAGFLEELSHHLAIERMHVIAPDIGTLATLAAATLVPDLFESMTLGSGNTSLVLAGKGLRDMINSPAGAFANIDGGDLALGFIRRTAQTQIPGDVLEDYRLSSAGRRFEDATNFVRAYLTDLPRVEPLLARIEVPALVISSDADAAVPPANGDFLAQRLPHCRHVILSGGGT